MTPRQSSLGGRDLRRERLLVHRELEFLRVAALTGRGLRRKSRRKHLAERMEKLVEARRIAR